MKFEALNPKTHDRKAFNCGVTALDLYLQKFANQDQKRSLTRVYVLAQDKQIIGYYSLSAHSIVRDNLPPAIKVGNYGDIPFLLLGRLAVDEKHQGHGYGEALVFHTCKTTTDAAIKVGVFGMLVEAKDQRAVDFYKGLGFNTLQASNNRLVLPISTMQNIISKCS